MKTIIAGGREFDDYELMTISLSDLPWTITEVVSGTARGADQFGELFAMDHDIPITRFPADWDKYGKSAGPLRNEEMAEYAEACVCFWNGSTHRSGTYHMINFAKERKLLLEVIRYEPPKITGTWSGTAIPA